MSNSCYIIQEREFIKSGEEIYKIGKTTQEGTKRLTQYSKGSKIILLMEVENCHEFENQVKDIFNKKYQRRKDLGNEYYEGDKDEMVKDYFELKKSIINVKIPNLKKNPQKNILDEKQTYYYPMNELEKFYEILKNSIDAFNAKNNTNIKYEYETIHILMPVYKLILNWYIRNESTSTELLKIKDKIEKDMIEYIYIKNIVKLLIETNINLENITKKESENIILNTLLLLDNNGHNSNEKVKIIKKMYETNKIKNESDEKKTIKEPNMKIYNNIIENKIIEQIEKIKKDLLLVKSKNYKEYNIRLNGEKRKIYSKYYENNQSFQNFDLKMLKNIESKIKEEIPYELIKDDENNYIGIKYETLENGARLITNITNLQDIIEEDLEGWITHNIKKVYKDEYQYMIGLNLKFNPLSLNNIIKKIINKTEININQIKKLYNDKQKDKKNMFEYYEYDVENYCSESESDNVNNDYFEQMYDIHELNTEIYDYLIKHCEKKITKNIIIEEKYYNELKEKKEKILNEFLKNTKILNYNEHSISIDDGEKLKIIVYNSGENNILYNNFNYISSNTKQIIRKENKINNILEYEEFLNSIMDESSINIFKNFAKSVLCDNKNLKCQIMNCEYNNIVEILLWLLYFIDYHKISINFKNEKIEDYKKELKLKKKIILLYVKTESEKKKALDIISKYKNNNYVIMNNTYKIIDGINVINNIKITNENVLKKYFNNNNEKIEYYEVYDLLDHELVMMFDWINGNNNLNEYIKNMS